MKRPRCCDEHAEEKRGDPEAPPAAPPTAAATTAEESPLAAQVKQKKRKVMLHYSPKAPFLKTTRVAASTTADIARRENAPASSVEALVCACRILNRVDATQTVSRALTGLLVDAGGSRSILKPSASVALSRKAKIMERLATHLLQRDPAFRAGLGRSSVQSRSLSLALDGTNEAVSRFFAESPQIARALIANAQATSLPA